MLKVISPTLKVCIFFSDGFGTVTGNINYNAFKAYNQ